jgi:hypothetical protein
MGEQTGGAVIGELLEGEVDLRLELDKGGGVASELLSPALLLFPEGCLEFLKGLLQSRNFRTGFAANAKLHSSALTRSPLLATSAILSGPAFLGFTFRECARQKITFRQEEKPAHQRGQGILRMMATATVETDTILWHL